MVDESVPLARCSDGEIRFYQAEVFRFSREEAAEELLVDAISSLSQEYLPSHEIKFWPRVASRESWWPKGDLADFYQAYVDSLNTFGGMVRTARRLEDLPNLTRALVALTETVDTVALGGWDVNWRQNAQWALRGSRFGLSGCSLVERYENLADRITLSERLEIIGGPIFYKQRRADGELGEVTPVVFAGAAEEAYEAVFLSLNGGVSRRYHSDWIVDERGACFRVLSD